MANWVLQEEKKSLDRARTFGIPIPDVQVVIGPSDRENYIRVYTIVDKIHGHSIDELPTDIPFPTAQLEDTVTNMINHTVDVFKNGGYCFKDFVKPGEMFMFGKRAWEKENQLWLVDIDLSGMNRKSSLDLILTLAYYYAVFDIGLMPKAKATLIECLRSIPKTDPNYKFAQRIFPEI